MIVNLTKNVSLLALSFVALTGFAAPPQAPSNGSTPAPAVAPAPTPAPSAGVGSAQVTKKHGDLFTSHTYLTMQFNQTIYRKLRNRTIERKGTAAFAQPGKFYWLFENPKSGNEEYYFDGKAFSQYIEKEKLLKHYGSSSSLALQLKDVIDMVLDSKALLTRYNAHDIKTEGSTTYATLTPKGDDPNNDIKSIDVKISEERKFLKEVKISYKDESTTTFLFKNPRTAIIPLTRFAFQKTEGQSITEKTIQ